MLEFSNDNFREQVLDSEGLVLVDFWGPACQPCLELMPHVEALEEKYPRVVFGKVNLSKNRRLAISQKVSRLPAILLYKDGTLQEMLEGQEATPQSVEALLDRFL